MLKPEGWPRAVQALYVYTVAALGFVPFAASSALVPALAAFFRPGSLHLALAALGPGSLAALLLALAFLVLEGRGLPGRLPLPLRQACTLLALVLCLLAAFGAGHLPFIYGAF